MATQLLARADVLQEPKLPTDAASVQRRSEPSRDAGPNSWPNPQSLRDQLQQLAGHPCLESWCCEVAAQLDLLRPIEGMDLGRIGAILDRLQELADAGRKTASVQDDLALGFEAARVAARDPAPREYLAAAHRIAVPATQPVSFRVGDSQQLARVAREALDPAGRDAHGELWQEYLLVDEVQQLAAAGNSATRPGAGK